MHIIYNNLNISIAAPVILAIIALIKWNMAKNNKKKNAYRISKYKTQKH